MLQTANLFTDHMVLQRSKPIPVWGWAAPGAQVTVTLDTAAACTTADSSGRWQTTLPAHAAARGLALRICSGSETISLTDVCVGEVWLAGGQSNMEFPMDFEAHIAEILSGPMNPDIRFFDCPKISYPEQLRDFSYDKEGFWRRCTPEDIRYFSAVGYYFAAEIQPALDVPVGILGCNWNGTNACTWLDEAYLEGTECRCWGEEFAAKMEGLDIPRYTAQFRANPANSRSANLDDPEKRRIYKKGLTLAEQAVEKARRASLPQAVIGPYYERLPGRLYETMVKQVHPYAIRGFLWYQGETDSDDVHAPQYTTMLTQLIRCWRDLWQEELPFLFVQLAPFCRWLNCGGENFPIVRACQEQVARTVPHTWMASIGDAGMQWDIHPKDKLPVGTRLGLLARGHVYGEKLLCDAPEFVSAEKIGDTIALTFAHGDGLHVQGAALNAMVAISPEGSAPLTQAQIQGNKLLLPGCKTVTRLEYAMTDFYQCNLYNAAHIPAKPFACDLP